MVTIRTLVKTLMGLVLVLGGLTTFQAPAQAAWNPDARTGYTKVLEKEAYLRNLAGKGFQILHVDTEHQTADGFWFAAKNGLDWRGFGWFYQPYGMWCGDTGQVIEWNGWTNSTNCGYNWPHAESDFPGFTERTRVCRETTGRPWVTGSFFAEVSSCDNDLLNIRTFQDDTTGGACAPWEGAACAQRYDWETATPNSFWLPEPDSCTKQAGPVPDCLGQDAAPNCAPGITHQACTGIPPKPVVSASVTKTVTVATGTASASVTKTKSRKVVVHQVKKTAKAKHKGKVYKVSRTGKIVVKFTRSATATATVTTGTATRTVTSSCAAETQDAAQACADAKAAAEATTQAQVAANADAKDKARAAAASQASIDVSVVFRDAVSSYKVTRAAKKALAKKTMKRAKRALAKKIAKVS